MYNVQYAEGRTQSARTTKHVLAAAEKDMFGRFQVSLWMIEKMLRITLELERTSEVAAVSK